MSEIDTIAAIATASGEGGISVIRISGPRCFSIADAVFRCRGPRPSERDAFAIVAGNIVEADGTALDEALLLVFRAPHSYTREDVVELQGHGGPAVTRRILRRVLDSGAKPAEPGEFTRRAFLNGRLDLVQAEAVLDLIRARTDRAAAAAFDQLQGGLTRQLDALYEALLLLAANMEATLDFSDQELPSGILDGLLARIEEQRAVVQKLLSTWNEGHLLREGARVVIAGRPNVGKSTLLNALLGRDRAIVSDQPGTTRDTIEEDLVLNGITLHLVDTAGLRDTTCEIEREGIRRAEDHLSRADLYLYMVDASEPVNDEDLNRLASLPEEKTLLIINKQDIKTESHRPWAARQKAIETSLSAGTGLDNIRKEIVQKLDAGSGLSCQHAVINERHRFLLDRVASSISEASELMGPRDGRIADSSLAAQCLREAVAIIGQITGREYREDLLNSIFSRFCIGK